MWSLGWGSIERRESRGIRAVLVAVVLAVAFSAGTIRGRSETPRSLGVEELSALLGLSLGSAAPAPPPTQTLLRRVAEVAEIKRDQIRGARVFQAEASSGSKRHYRICHLPIDDAEVGASVLAAVDQDGEFAGVAILDGSGDAIPSWKHFLEQFKFKGIPKIEGAMKSSAFEGLQKDGTKLEGAVSDLRPAVVRLMRHMQEQAVLFNLPRRGGYPPELLARVSKEYAGVADLGEEFVGLLGGAKERFVEIAEDSAKVVGEMEKAVRKGDRQGLQPLSRRLIRNCRACHNLTDSSYEGVLKDRFEAQRDGLGLGDGLYRVGFDLRIRHEDRDLSQRASNALRQAFLLLDG